MNTAVASKESILAVCRSLVMEKGISSINMRSVASACGIAVGSLYNYFPSKGDLIAAAVGDVWRDIFHTTGDYSRFHSFTECMTWLFANIQEGSSRYPGFFCYHSIIFTSNDKEKGKVLMDQYFDHIKKGLLFVIEQDRNIRPDAFNDRMTKEDFIELVFTLFTSMLLNGQTDCGPLLEITERCLYKQQSHDPNNEAANA